MNPTRKRGREKDPEREFEELVDEGPRRREKEEEPGERREGGDREDSGGRRPARTPGRGKRLDLLV